jgi:hypothetical protein
VTDADSRTQESVDAMPAVDRPEAEAPPPDVVSPQVICACCGLEMPEGDLASLVTQPLPVVSRRRGSASEAPVD